MDNARPYRMIGYTPLNKPENDITIWALAFAVDGKFIVSGGTHTVRVRRVADGRQMAKMAVRSVNCVAVSRDGSRIAAGTSHGELWQWDARTYEEICMNWLGAGDINAIDFSPDSSRLAIAWSSFVSIRYQASTGKKSTSVSLQRINHTDCTKIVAVKFSPHGNLIATATSRSVRLYDGDNGDLQFKIPVTITPWYNTGLAWFNNHLFLVSNNKIKQFDTSTRSSISEWPVSNPSHSSCIALSPNGDFIAYATNRTITFWDISSSTHTQLGHIQHPQNIRSIALTPDGHSIAISGEGGQVSMKCLSGITGPDIQISTAIIHSWECNQLASAETSLTAAIAMSPNPARDLFIGRALVRARLQQWDAAIDDAQESVDIQPSVIGLLAKSRALVGKGEVEEGYRACDLAFEHAPPAHIRFVLLTKAIITFLAGHHNSALSRMDDLMVTVPFNSTCLTVKVYMYFLTGRSFMESGDYEHAIQPLQSALEKQSQHSGTSRLLQLISLIFGWTFDGLWMVVRQNLCYALLAVGRRNDAMGLFLQTVKMFGKETYQMESMMKWISDFMHQCLSTSDSGSSRDASHVQSLSDVPDLMVIEELAREWVKVNLTNRSWRNILDASINFVVPRSMIYQMICERLEAMDRMVDAIQCLQQMKNAELAGEICMNDAQAKWFTAFKHRPIKHLEHFATTAMNAGRYADVITQCSAALALKPTAPQVIYTLRSKAYAGMGLWVDAINDTARVISLDPSSSWGYNAVLTKWARAEVTNTLQWESAVKTAGNFDVPRFFLYQVVCERLESLGGIKESANCFQEMERTMEVIQGEGVKWFHDFKSRISGRLEELGDTVMGSRQYDQAIHYFSAAVSLSPTSLAVLFIKRSRAYSAKAVWEDALADANKAIALDPSSPFSYETKYEALRGAGRHEDMSDAFHAMMQVILHSSNSEIRNHYGHYIETRGAIHRATQDVVRELPQVLINTTSGRLYHKSEQVTAFERLPGFIELVSSMTTEIDYDRIKKEVTDYYRYATFSHKWEDNEPLFEKVIRVVVYDLDKSPTHDKLQKFCKIVRDAGFHWAWSDTCCINKADHFVLQEALVAMFKWYTNSALTVIFLRGVCSPSKRGDLTRSVWNTRGWTLQEYHASKVVRFYTEDWTPYLNLDMPNHKESVEVILEMEEATGVSVQMLMALKPGTDDIREKLGLASHRETTKVEDVAYSLFGIFSVHLPIIYGEGNKALGRLLAYLITSSGDTSILAWSGKSGDFNSCLPADIAVFSHAPTSHIPPVANAAVSTTSAVKPALTAPADPLLMKLYDRLSELPAPFFIDNLLTLPCITFRLGPLSQSRTGSSSYRAKTDALGIVEINTAEKLSPFDSLILVHPWMDFLLNRQPLGEITTVGGNGPDTLTQTQPHMARGYKQTQMARLLHNLLQFNTQPRETVSLLSPLPMTLADKRTEALNFLARLREPFGALLLRHASKNTVRYRRVAADSSIIVQIKNDIPFDVLISNTQSVVVVP